ncbi:MAG: hypothetical protein ACWGOY_03115 [Anaerolineales bacterium]
MQTSSSTQIANPQLDAIRQAETEAARKITAAQKAAEQRIAYAQVQANQLKEKAVEEGRIAGQQAADEHLAQVHARVKTLLAQADIEKNLSIQNGLNHMDEAVKFAVSYVIGNPEKE